MSVITTHFVQRIQRRLNDNGISFIHVKKEVAKIVKTTFDASVSYAIMVKDLGEFFGDDCFDYHDRYESNGSVLWVVIRNNRAVTFFLRRTNQPSTPEALRVDKIVRVQVK